MTSTSTKKNESPNEIGSSDITVFAKANFRNQLTAFGIKRADRRAHLYLPGKTGTAKSTLLESLMLDDAKKGFGFALLDPKEFWVKEFDKYPERLRVEAISPIQNKVGAFLSHPLLQKILTKPEKPLSLRRIMDEGKILLVNLAKGILGEDASLFGAVRKVSYG